MRSHSAFTRIGAGAARFRRPQKELYGGSCQRADPAVPRSAVRQKSPGVDRVRLSGAEQEGLPEQDPAYEEVFAAQQQQRGRASPSEW